MTDRVIVRTGDRTLAEVAATLIALADDPHEVVWEHRAGHLTVPEYVAVRYADSMTADGDEGGDAHGDAVEEAAAAAAPARRKPGRPRKTDTVVQEEVN